MGWDGMDLRVGGGIEHLTVLITVVTIIVILIMIIIVIMIVIIMIAIIIVNQTPHRLV